MRVPVTANYPVHLVLHCCGIPGILFYAAGDHSILGFGVDEASNQASLNPGSIDRTGSLIYLETTTEAELH